MTRTNPIQRIMRTTGLWVCLGLLSLTSAASAQDPPQEALKPGEGVLVFESLPANISNPSQSSFYWRIPAVPLGELGPLPLDQLQVVLVPREGTGQAREAEVKLRGYGAWPPSAVVTPGQKVRFLNQDPVSYTLEVEGREMEPIKVGGQGSQTEVTLTRPGRYVFRDTEYTSVTSYVIVTEQAASSPLRAVDQEQARFAVGSLPAGAYRLEVYFQGEPLPSMTRDVTVTSDGRLAPARFLVTAQDFQGIQVR